MIDPGDASDLEAYFGPAGGGGRSTFGSTLERQALRYQTSDGRVVDARRIVTVTRELADSTEEHPHFASFPTPWAYMPVRREVPAVIEEDEERLHQERQLAARISRRLRQLDPRPRAVLELLYGDQGCRWSREKWGRVWVLVPTTKAARRVLGRDDLARQEQGQPASPLQPAERLAMLAGRQPRPTWVDSALDQAEGEQERAEAAWKVAW
jgi:hypothetical protein